MSNQLAVTTHIQPESIAAWLRARGSRNISRDITLATNDHKEFVWGGIKYDVRLVRVGEYEYYDVNMWNLIV